MEILDSDGNKIDINSVEKTEQDLANEFILANDIVLELGARYGSVSCTINNKLSNKKNQVSVEPDERVWEALEINKINNKCDFNIVKGFISSKKLSLTNIDDCNGYGSTCIENNNSNIPSFSLNEIQEKYNLKFNVLIADCEGFLGDFFDENPDFYDNLRLIIFEADYPEKCDYNKIKNNLIKKNFTKIIEGSQNLWVKFESEEVKYYQKGLKYNLFYKINEGYFLEKTTQSKELGQFYLDYFAIEERKTKLVKFFVAISQTDLDIKKKMFNDLINDPDCDNDIKTWSNYNLGLLHPK